MTRLSTRERTDAPMDASTRSPCTCFSRSPSGCLIGTVDGLAVVFDCYFFPGRVAGLWRFDADLSRWLYVQGDCKLGLEGIVSKKLDAPYRSGPSKTWIKIKNPKAPAATRAVDGTF
jgi:hypothetical protein